MKMKLSNGTCLEVEVSFEKNGGVWIKQFSINPDSKKEKVFGEIFLVKGTLDTIKMLNDKELSQITKETKE